MCASPGNKTTHIAQLMNDIGRIIALDKSRHRVSILKKNIELFQFKCVECFVFDATKAVSEAFNNNWSPPFSEESFDRILLDAPCSGFGNRPILSTNMTIKSLASYPKLQRKLLECAIKLLKVGGILVYSTCTVLPEENEENVAWMLKKYDGKIELECASPLFGGPGLRNTGLNKEQLTKVQRFGPCNGENTMQNVIDSTGFFICKFKKKLQL